MKKLIYSCISLCLLVACNPKESKEYKQLQAERDSLLQKTSSDANEMAELMSVIDEVEENFSKIKEAEKYLSTQAMQSGELTRDAKSRIKDNFEMVTEILNKNKAQLEQLTQRLNNSKGEISTLRKTLERLNNQLEERSNTISSLQSTLAQKDYEIATLNISNENLSQKVSGLHEENTHQAQKISEQDKELHTGYFVFGTNRELKERKIISGGFLSSTKVLKGAFDKNYFIQVDIRELKELPLYDKKAKLLSNHPEGSYEFIKDNNQDLVLKIKDYKQFWSLGQYLVIQVK